MIAPPADKSHLVASRSYVTYSKAELRDKLDRNPYSYLHVINPTGIESSKIKRGTQAFFELVRERYLEFKASGWLNFQGESRFAIYRQSSKEHTCTGIVASLSLDGIRNGQLKLHEQTLKKREQLFARYLSTVHCNAEPVLCAFDDNKQTDAVEIQKTLSNLTQVRPDMDFTTTDQIRHSVWILSDEESQALAAKTQKLTPLYLADGHHRVASSLALENLGDSEAKSSGLMAFIIPESELVIRGYHRSLKDVDWSADRWDAELQGLSPFISCQRIKREKLSEPNRVGTIHLHAAGKSWVLKLNDSSLERVDADILQTHVFEGLFGIEDARNDPKLTYIPGTMSSAELIAHCDEQTDSCIFEMSPISSAQIKSTADRGGFLPPKSSWIEPKLRSGLFIHEI